MPTTYEKAADDITDEITRIIEKHYPDLRKAGVTVGCFMAEKRDAEGELKDEPALKLHGVAAGGIVKINSLKDRAEGKTDATILLDGNRWNDWTDGNHTALLHHELHHLMVRRDGAGEDADFKHDDLGRPMMKMRPHDFQVGWFDEIARLYGDASFEVKQAKEFADQKGQLYFGWTAPPESSVESQPAKKSQKKNVVTADGRHITPDEMISEIGAQFAAKR